MVHLKITPFKRNIIWTKPPLLCSMLIFQGVFQFCETWNLRVTPKWKGTSFEPNFHFGVSMLIFADVLDIIEFFAGNPTTWRWFVKSLDPQIYSTSNRPQTGITTSGRAIAKLVVSCCVIWSDHLLVCKMFGTCYFRLSLIRTKMHYSYVS